MSLANLLMILPLGFVSKKDIGALSTDFSIFSWRFVEADNAQMVSRANATPCMMEEETPRNPYTPRYMSLTSVSLFLLSWVHWVSQTPVP